MFHCNGLKLAFRMYKQLIQTGTCISFIYIYIKNIAARYGKFYFHATNPGIKARFHRRDQPALNISNCFLLFFFLFLLSLSRSDNVAPRKHRPTSNVISFRAFTATSAKIRTRGSLFIPNQGTSMERGCSCSTTK